MSNEERINFTSKRIVAVHGSKGGTGASMIVSNLGIFLAQIGKQVLLIDANLSNSSLYAWLGSVKPQKNISDVLYQRVNNISDAITETHVTGLYMLAGSTGIEVEDIYKDGRFDRLWKQIQNIEADYIIIDLPATMDQFTLDLSYLADYAITVTLPLPDAIETTYNFMAAVWFRGLTKILDESGILESSNINLQESFQGNINPRQIINFLEDLNETAASAARKFTRIFHPQIIINQIRIKEDEHVGNAMVSATTRWLGFAPLLLGSIGWDDNVWLSLRRTKPLLIDFSGSRACKDLEEIVRTLTGLEYKDLTTPFAISPDTGEQNYYELLEIYPGASEEEVRRAFKQIKLWFGLEGIACRGVCSNVDREKFQLMAEKAHAQLVDRSKRREYDKLHFPDGFSSAINIEEHRQQSIVGTVAVTQASLPKVELTDDQFVDGAFLGKIRKERNIDLVDISNRAKISVRYLQAIEEERFEDLPAAVFTRGFVTEFARFLKVDPTRAASDFMAVYSSRYEKK